MPIRPELRKFYGPGHRAKRLELIVLAGGCCQRCGVRHPMLNAAHEFHNPADAEQIIIWCPSCHAKHDAPHRLAMMRRSRADRVGQMWLSPELQYAPYPAWLIGVEVRDAATQLRLI